MKLFKVEVTYQTVILAETAEQAERNAGSVVRYDDDGDPAVVVAQEITKCEQLPAPWNPQCRPFGEDDPKDRTIGEILAGK